MRSKLLLASLLLLSLGSTGCVMKMKKDDFERPIVQTREQLDKIREDYAAKSKLYNAITSRSSTPNAAPYPEMKSLLGKMYAVVPPLVPYRDRLNKMEMEFTGLREGRPDMSSDRPQWKPFMKLYDEMKVILPKVNEQMQAYGGFSNRFAELAGQYDVRELKAADVKGQLGGSLASLDKAAEELRGQMAVIRQKLKERAIATLGIDQQRKRKEIVGQLEALTGQLEATGAGLKGKVSAFEAALQGQAEVYTGPGLPKIEAIDAVAKGMEQVRGYSSQINELVSKWNAMN